MKCDQPFLQPHPRPFSSSISPQCLVGPFHLFFSQKAPALAGAGAMSLRRVGEEEGGNHHLVVEEEGLLAVAVGGEGVVVAVVVVEVEVGVHGRFA